MSLFRRRPAPERFSAEDQLAALERFGICLRPGLTRHEVLARHDANKDYIEGRRFGLLEELAVDHESDPLDTVPGVARAGGEGVEDDDSYPNQVRLLANAARRSGDLFDVRSRFEPDQEVVEVEYTISGEACLVEADVAGDWFDGIAIGYIAEDLSSPGQRCAW